MSFSFLDFLTLLGSLGFFIYGMKVMSEGLQKVAGSRMRQILRAMTSNRVMGVFTGFLITSLVQSSSATTVMVVSFVNAGLLSLVESIGVVMGANIGTTVTAWIISIIGFKIKMGAAALPLIAVGFPLIFSSKNKVKSWGEVIIGFALLFMGLDLLKGSVPDIKSNPEILEFLADYTDLGFVSTLLFVLIGTALTVIIQSSSATMALTLVMANEGWITFDIAAAMVLGENIGTTITANVAALVANVHAKRTARAHFIFNIFGVIWMLVFMPLFLSGISYYMASGGGTSPYDDPSAIPIALSIFHTSFNVINVVVLIWFTNFIASVVTKIVKPGNEDDALFKLEYIGSSLVTTPEISLEQASKELVKFGEITSKMSGFIQELMLNKNQKGRNKLVKRIKKYESITDEIEVEIANYLSKVGSSNLSEESSLRLRNLLSISSDLESTGDLFYQMMLTIEKKTESEEWFTDKEKEDLADLFTSLDAAMAQMVVNLGEDHKKVTIDKAQELENEINKKRKKLKKKYLKNVEKNSYDVLNSVAFTTMYDLIETAGDYVFNVSEGITGQTSLDEEDR